ncbi:MAG: molybdopterin synthase [ANME-2 cluster archaeon]|nr:molybdopterin synthase [ANME-2 cluster archaeon]
MKIISVAGHKKSGKTSLVERLVRELEKRGRTGTIKHLPDHEFNPQGTDTRRHMEAGASVVVGVTPSGIATFTPRATLENALDELANSGIDYAVVEGFKDSRLPKIALGDLELHGIVKNISGDPASLTDTEISDLINIIEQQPEYHTLDSLIYSVKHNPFIKETGAIGSFTGIVRQKTGDIKTESLEFESHEKIAGDRMHLIENDLKNKEGVQEVRIHHKTGWIGPGQDIVYIVVATSHRQQLFPALSDAIERVKSEVPIWKKEHTTSGKFWVHEHP